MIASGSHFDTTPVHPLDATAGGALEIRHAPPDGDARTGSALHGVLKLPGRVLLALLFGYQRFVSPVLPIVTLGACACRFAPTCSQYAVDAVRTHGALMGTALALRRLLKCTPLHPGGFDPVPPRRSRPTCHPVIR